MGSLEDEQLVQMVHDFIESDSTTVPIFSASNKTIALSLHNQSSRYFTKLQEILRGSDSGETEAEILKCVLKHMCRNRKVVREYETEKTSTNQEKRWLALRLTRDGGYRASLRRTSWPSSLGCAAGEYEYVEIMMEDGERVILDIEFRPQFEVARPTSAYKQLTDSLPTIFVGRENQLMKIVSLLCSAAKQSLRERGLHLPPWRTNTYMLSKWLSSSVSSTVTYSETSSTTTTHRRRNSNSDNDVTELEGKQPNRSARGRLGGGGCLSSQLSNMTINCR